MRKILASLIAFYQKRISPHKGFFCAHRCLYKGDSCSEYTRKQILQSGLFASLDNIKNRFSECRAAANNIHQRPPLSQRGDCDLGLGACDVGDCDACSKKGSAPFDCMTSSCDLLHLDKKNRKRDFLILVFVIIAIVLIVSYFVFK